MGPDRSRRSIDNVYTLLYLRVVAEVIDGEERYRSVGLTDRGRFLLVWTVRDGDIRAVTGFPASVSNKKAFLEKPR